MENRLTFLLIHPEISRTRYNFVGVIENECLELEYIAAMLKREGHTVYIYDGQVEKISVKVAIRKYAPQVVYVCGRTRQENFMLEYCCEAKRHDSRIITIIGGLHAQLCYERMYKPYVDYILTSFDIYNILELIKSDVRPEKLNSVCYKIAGRWQHTKEAPFDIKRLPRPDRSYYYEHPNNYRYLELEHAAWVRTAYCCPYRCSFCSRNRMNSGKYSVRPIEDVVDEIESIKSDNIYIVDDDFLFDEERLSTFVRLIKEKGIKKNYICYGRADFIANHQKLMRELKEIGLYYVLVGLEAINNRYLKNYNKRSDMKNNLIAIRLCNKLKINIMGMFIVDLDFTARDFRELYRFIVRKSIKHVAISIYTPELGTSEKQKFITDNPSHFDYLHLVAKPTKLSVRRYYFNYYILLIRLFLKAQRDGIYDFIDYGDYIKSFVINIFKKRENDDE